VIVNKHLKLKMVNGNMVWESVFSGKGTRPSAKNRQKSPILDPKILRLKYPVFWLLSYKVWRPVLYDLLAPPEVQLTPIGGR